MFVFCSEDQDDALPVGSTSEIFNISNPDQGEILSYDGTHFTNTNILSGSNIDLINIDPNNLASTIPYSKLPNLAGIVLSGASVPPYIASITPITPSGTQEIEILGEYFSPITQLSISGVVIESLEVRSPNKIIANINKTGLSGNKIITLANGPNSNQLWAEGIKTIDIFSDPYWQNVSLFLKGDGENNSINIIDSSPNPKTITRIGDTKISTAQAKYGGSSIYFDGNDYLSGNLPLGINIRSSLFTVEGWIYLIQNTNFSLFGSHPGGDFYFQLVGGVWYIGDGVQNNIVVSSQAPGLNQWVHVALSFDGTTYRLFKDGLQIGQSQSLLKNYSITAFQIGSRTDQAMYINGCIDSFRITEGVARYTASFSPETDTYLNT